MRRLLPLLLISALAAAAQSTTPPLGQLDPTRSIATPVLFSSFHQPLPEQYIWTHDPGHQSQDQQDAPRYFRATFRLHDLPPVATLYLAGPQNAEVWVNGTEAVHFDADPLSRLKTHVFAVNISQFLRPGNNTLAIEADHGRTLVAKILPTAQGIDAPALLITSGSWKAAAHAGSGWQTASADSWPDADARGSIEGNIDFFQWNDDAGMYDWPGYEGASPFLAHAYFPATRILEVYPGNGRFENTSALTQSQPDPKHEFAVHGGLDITREYTPSITLDFGREVTGRLQVVSDSDSPAVVSIAYGESLGELDNEPYLGDDAVLVDSHATVVGPKSAFRYARVRFLAGADFRAKAIRLEDIYYPVRYQGSFESSDAFLNRIWETGAYTSHLCMQDDIWDAPKRDRGRWMGDTDVSGRVIDAVFADQFLVEDTLTRLIGPLPIREHVNGIPGYSSFWFTELADYLRHTGRIDYVSSMQPRIVALLKFMDQDFDAQNRFINHTHEWLYVDWSLGLNGETPESRQTTVLEYIRAYRDGAWLLRQVNDASGADHWAQRADALAAVARASGVSDGSYGPRWQTNAMAVISGVAQPDQYASIWQSVLSQVGQPTFRPNVITPYYGSYVLDAMAQMNHRPEALAWIREYWGGMIAEGATSFWEAYDPAWPKDDPHVDLQADDTAGYRISLAHGWSSAPTFWLMEQVLGIQPTAPGFAQTTLRPDLVDLDWARGAEPTPHGLLSVDLHRIAARTGPAHDSAAGLDAVIDLPPGVTATVLMPAASGSTQVLVNGSAQSGTSAENGARVAIVLDHPGHYHLRTP